MWLERLNYGVEGRWKVVGWLVGCFGFNGPFRQYFSLYRAEVVGKNPNLAI